jgi:hypothetical protein
MKLKLFAVNFKRKKKMRPSKGGKAQKPGVWEAGA